MINRLGIQLFTIRDFMQDEKDMDESFAKLAKLGYTTVQTAGYEGEAMANAAKKHGITVVGTHYDTEKIFNNPEETIAVHKLLGTTNIGIGGMPGEARESYENLMAFIEKFNKAAALYAKEGFKLTYHNHSFEFVEIKDGKSIMDYLYEGLDKDNVSFVLDTCWVAHGGADVRHWLEKLAGRVDILHLKDIKPFLDSDSKMVGVSHKITEIGNGSIWWDGVLETAEKTGVKEYVVEQDLNWIDGDPFKSLEFSKNYLAKYLE
jgi:sugar phosphate isomerase/epimerase